MDTLGREKLRGDIEIECYRVLFLEKHCDRSLKPCPGV
jgi:hypothetical protein